MAVEVGTDAVQHLAGEAVVLPLLCVELEHALVHQVLPVLPQHSRETAIGQVRERECQRIGQPGQVVTSIPVCVMLQNIDTSNIFLRPL